MDCRNVAIEAGSGELEDVARRSLKETRPVHVPHSFHLLPLVLAQRILRVPVPVRVGLGWKEHAERRDARCRGEVERVGRFPDQGWENAVAILAVGRGGLTGEDRVVRPRREKLKRRFSSCGRGEILSRA